MKLSVCLWGLMVYASTAAFAGGGQALQAFLSACSNGDYQTVQACLRENRALASTAVICDRPERNYTPLHAATVAGYAKIVRALHEAGADVNGHDGWGATPLMLLCQHCLLYTSPSPRDRQKSRMPSSA